LRSLKLLVWFIDALVKWLDDVFIKPFYANDILSIHKMYESLSEESKEFFHPRFLGFKNINLSWIRAQLLLIVSTVSVLRRILWIFSISYLLALVAINDDNEVIAFGYLWVKKNKPKMGAGVKDAYQSRGIGTQLIEKLIELGRTAQIRKLFVTFRTDNVRSARICKKLGFKKGRIIRNADIWQMRRHDSIEMMLELS
jgi:RimJ/RimL family protein N-acetyltransferase